MTIEEFRLQVKEAGLNVRKQKNLEKFDVRYGDIQLFTVWYAQIRAVTDISELLAKHHVGSYAPTEKETTQ